MPEKCFLRHYLPQYMKYIISIGWILQDEEPETGYLLETFLRINPCGKQRKDSGFG